METFRDTFGDILKLNYSHLKIRRKKVNKQKYIRQQGRAVQQSALGQSHCHAQITQAAQLKNLHKLRNFKHNNLFFKTNIIASIIKLFRFKNEERVKINMNLFIFFIFLLKRKSEKTQILVLLIASTKT
jgi:hypothetical protein